MKKIVTIAGTRPQLVKIAAVSHILRQSFHEVLVNTGQHYDYNLAGVFFDELNIPKPDYDLGIGSDTHGRQTGKMLIAAEEVVEKEQPDAILVYGDTNSTLAGALVASKLHIPLIHIEAGLRSYNKLMPEEINRIMTDHVSDLLFTPTEVAVRNLQNEGITKGVFTVGDVMYDAVLNNMERAEQKYNLADLGLTPKEYYLGTIHRPDNTDSKEVLTAILTSFSKLKEAIYLPLHPRTKKKVEQFGLGHILEQAKNIKIVEPVSYLEMLLLEKNAKGIITDSGGIQKEAYFMKVPCITLRTQTEWVETVETGWNQLVDPLVTDLANILQKTQNGQPIDNIYGDGNAATRITKILEQEI
ncbi:non-hydrolyzing UDP-N-acetylglucosamine 2-epimerase [Ureibacillus acetophenoni]|uniref:UDP-N-acetylglucosamine 2-epimerase (Non-hydrolysing)/UDP-GlcNAc3NAcA epimerase n=1 Tax=Ureibacillus acetophenoni TaxID=614649 RepID=A0A285UCW2_9BACL|nr:UDP-N-acetylglucosamine 2-epimerase (non-hydrolyzing) [Ureibacillus acetophenoni]SOC38426.1 UDP-N-acetylglucosamine 2-epimerase (non-hydrolysing)/UDP-GlcNAc3NAcA epimerase [Ureibacillus acetophenoni]